MKENPHLNIPLRGNGDITTPEKAEEAFSRYGVDGVMVGRASIGAPWIFREIKNHLEGNSSEGLSLSDKFSLLRRQITESIGNIDEYRGILHIRRHLAASPLFKGIPHFRDTRVAMLRAETWDELDKILSNIEHNILPQFN